MQLLRNLVHSQQPAAQQLLQALVARIKESTPTAEARPNSRGSLTGSGGQAPKAAPSTSSAPPDNTGSAAALAALQALLARQAAPGGAAPGEGPAAPAEGAAVQGPSERTMDEVLQFLLDYVPEHAERLPGAASSPLAEHLDQVAALVAQQRPGLVTYLTHVMAPPTNAAGTSGGGVVVPWLVDDAPRGCEAPRACVRVCCMRSSVARHGVLM